MMFCDVFPILKEPNIITLFFRIILVFICAGIIGYERDVHGATAGFRTHLLVCLGSMIAMSTGQFAELYYNVDVTRIGAQVVSGIGFLGAGSIIVNKRHIRGLTTAAGLWASASIGLAIGIGFYEGAVMGAAAVFFIERGLKNVSLSIQGKYGDNKDDSSDNESSDLDSL